MPEELEFEDDAAAVYRLYDTEGGPSLYRSNGRPCRAHGAARQDPVVVARRRSQDDGVVSETRGCVRPRVLGRRQGRSSSALLKPALTGTRPGAVAGPNLTHNSQRQQRRSGRLSGGVPQVSAGYERELVLTMRRAFF